MGEAGSPEDSPLGPRYIEFHMHESYGEPTATGYIVNELASSISVFLLNKDVCQRLMNASPDMLEQNKESALTLIQTISTIPHAFPRNLNTCGRVAVHPSGRWVVVSNITPLPGPSPVAPSCIKVTTAVLYFRLSPIIITLDTPLQNDLKAFSIGTGAIFSPPAPMISSLYLPVILSIPSLVIQPLSPECSQPSSSIDWLVLSRISDICASPSSALPM